MDIAFIDSTFGLLTKILSNNCKRKGMNSVVIASEAYDQLERDIIQLQPKIIAISWNFNEVIYKFLCLSLKRIKRILPDIKIIIHSYGATYDWKNLSEVKEIDYIVGGEADEGLPNLCEELLNGKNPNKFAYLNNLLPSLEDYDYDNNWVLKNGILVIATSRNCIYWNNRCWYCSCYKLPYRQLNLDKIIEGLKKNVDFTKVKRITLVDPEVMPQAINRLYEEFNKPIHCFILFKNLLKLSPELKYSNSNIIFGINAKKENLHSNVEYTPEKIDMILEKINDMFRGGNICLSTTLLVTDKEDEAAYNDILEVFDRYKGLINPNFNYYRKTPRYTNGDEIKENIYLEYKRNKHVWFDCVTNVEDAL